MSNTGISHHTTPYRTYQRHSSNDTQSPSSTFFISLDTGVFKFTLYIPHRQDVRRMLPPHLGHAGLVRFSFGLFVVLRRVDSLAPTGLCTAAGVLVAKACTPRPAQHRLSFTSPQVRGRHVHRPAAGLGSAVGWVAGAWSHVCDRRARLRPGHSAHRAGGRPEEVGVHPDGRRARARACAQTRTCLCARRTARRTG